jgi:hypothetical protein
MWEGVEKMGWKGQVEGGSEGLLGKNMVVCKGSEAESKDIQ